MESRNIRGDDVSLLCSAIKTWTRDTHASAAYPEKQATLHQSLVRPSCLRFPRRGERGQPFTVGRNLETDIFIRREGPRDAPTPEHRDKAIPILLDISYADPQAPVHLRGGSADHDGSAPPPPPRHASANTFLVRDKCPSATIATSFPSFTVDSFGV